MVVTKLLVVIPVFNDWVAAGRLLAELDEAIHAENGPSTSVLIVDDGSPLAPPDQLIAATLHRIATVDILRLRHNVGHQRAIAIALAHTEATTTCDAIVVMDGDGEDRPEDVPRLLEALAREGGKCIIFAERTRRSEGALFSVLYRLYRTLHKLLTGEAVRVGNFSVIPGAMLEHLVALSDLWNHYAAAVFKSRIPYRTVPTSRGYRYAGQSQMNYVALIGHGLSAMSVFGERIGVRLLVVTLGSAMLVLVGVTGMVTFPLITGQTWPAWMPYVFGLSILACFQALAVALTFVFVILAGRNGSPFIPIRDHRYFVAGVTSVYPQR